MSHKLTLGAVGAAVVAAVVIWPGAASALPDASEAEEKAMIRVPIGKAAKLDSPSGKVGFTVKSIRFADYRGWPEGSGRIAVAIVVRNFSKTWANGLQVNLRCGTSTEEGGYYVDSTIEAQSLPPRTQESGVLFIGMPKDAAEKGRPCTNARIVLRPSTFWDFSSGYRNFAAVVRVPRGVADQLR